MKKVLALWIALMALTAGSSPSANTKLVIITFKAGTPAAARAKVLSGIKGTAVSRSESTDQGRAFTAVVADVPATPKAAAVFGAFDAGGSAGASVTAQDDPSVASVEEDFTAKWIENAPATLGEAPFINNGAALGALGLQSFKA